MKKKQKTYSASELRDLRLRVANHARTLTSRIIALASEQDFDSACELRDAAQELTTARMLLNEDRGILAVCESLATMSGEPQSVPHLDSLEMEATP